MASHGIIFWCEEVAQGAGHLRALAGDQFAITDIFHHETSCIKLHQVASSCCSLLMIWGLRLIEEVFFFLPPEPFLPAE